MPAFSTLNYILRRWKTTGDRFWEGPSSASEVVLEANANGTVTQVEIDTYVFAMERVGQVFHTYYYST